MLFLRAAPSLSSVFSWRDDKLIQHLQTERIPFVAFDGAESYSDRYGAHWTPEGHKLVPERLLRLLSENNITQIGNLSR